MSEIKPTDTITISVSDFEKKYVSRVSYDELKAQYEKMRDGLVWYAQTFIYLEECPCSECLNNQRIQKSLYAIAGVENTHRGGYKRTEKRKGVKA